MFKRFMFTMACCAALCGTAWSQPYPNKPTRLPQLPDVPTFAELGFEGVNAAAMVGIVAPAGTPPEAIAILQQKFAAAVKTPVINKRLVEFGVEPVGSNSADFAELLQRENARWSKLVGELKIVLD